MKYRLLTLTDHRTHSSFESIYPLLAEMQRYACCTHIDVASRGNTANTPFFFEDTRASLMAMRVGYDFRYQEDGSQFLNGCFDVSAQEYDAILMRIDRPVNDSFLDSIAKAAGSRPVINDPAGIKATASKDFLINVRDHCPPIEVCNTIGEIKRFASTFHAVLKPLRN